MGGVSVSVRIAWLFGLAGLVPFGVAVLAIWSPGTVMLGMAPGVALGGVAALLGALVAT